MQHETSLQTPSLNNSQLFHIGDFLYPKLNLFHLYIKVIYKDVFFLRNTLLFSVFQQFQLFTMELMKE